MIIRKAFFQLAICLCCSNAIAQSVDKDNELGKPVVAVVELGASASRERGGGASAFGPSVGVEVEPIENWLELEAGITPLFKRGATEWNTDLILKKPWTLSSKAELMIGVGPEWVHVKSANSISGEVALDFMYWASARHKFGWYFEPAYEYSFARGHERSVGVTAGLLIAVR
jgi:hypothetical protein